MTWAARADALIMQIDAELPAGADLKARRSALRAKAYWFHGGTSWGRRVWSARSAVYLARHGAKPRKAPQAAFYFGPDIIFPYREART